MSEAIPAWRLHLIRMAKCEDLHAIPDLARQAMLHIETLEEQITNLILRANSLERASFTDRR